MIFNTPLIVVLLFVLRLLVPISVLFGLSYLYQKLSEYWVSKETHKASPTVSTWKQPAVLTQSAKVLSCWEVTNCPAEKRAACAAAKRPGVPCWLTMQLAEGHLPERCINCPVFTSYSPA